MNMNHEPLDDGNYEAGYLLLMCKCGKRFSKFSAQNDLVLHCMEANVRETCERILTIIEERKGVHA